MIPTPIIDMWNGVKMESSVIASEIIRIMLGKIEHCQRELKELEQTNSDRVLGCELINECYVQWEIAYSVGIALLKDDDINRKIFQNTFRSMSICIDNFGNQVSKW